MLGATPREASLMARLRKPLQRLPQPGLNRGKVQRAIRRAFLLPNEISTGDATRMAYPRYKWLSPSCYAVARRALARVAVPVGRAPGHGRPLLWRMRDTSE